MRIPALLSLLLVPTLAQAVICKTVGPDGVVSYTDVPVEECRTPIRLPDYSRYAPRPVQPAPRPSTAETAPAAEPAFDGYREMQIIQPEPGGTVRSAEGQVAVGIRLDPALQEGHLVNLYIDGERVRGSFAGVDIELSGIERGTHTLRAEVVDAGGRRLVGAAPLEFTLRKPGLFDGAAPPSAPAPTPPPAGQ